MGNRTRYFCDQTLDQTENISVHFHAFLDPVGSLVSTLWVVGCGWVVTLFLKV